MTHVNEQLTLADRRARFRAHSNPEIAQSVTRIIMVLIVCAYFSLTENSLIFNITATYFPFALAFLLWQFFSPGENHLRRVLMAFGDIGTTSLCLSLVNGEDGALSIGLYMWIIVGYGFRYGVSYVYLTMALVVTGFVAVILIHPFWSSHPHMAAGNLVLILVVPLFMARLIHKLHHAIDAAETANRAKSQFITHMSHELRTPLNAIIGMNDLSLDSRLNQEQQRYAGVIKDSSYHLLALIEHILDMSRIEAGKMELTTQSFDLHQLMHGVIAMFEGQSKEQGTAVTLHIAPNIPCLLVGDAGHLKQILLNLVGNAVKFTEQGRVAVSIEPMEISETAVSLSFLISDSGIGMSEEMQEKIFEQFNQADAGITRRYGGTGLGTTIAKSFTELMGGSISLESQTGKGSVFTITLPFERQIETAATTDDPLEADMPLLAGQKHEQITQLVHNRQSCSLHILLAEDNPVNQKVIQAMLNRAGHQVTIAEDGEQALEALAGNEIFDLALLDVNMPKASGLEVVRQCRMMSRHAALPVLMLSADAQPETIRNCLNAGADDYLTKPVQMALLLQKVAGIADHQAGRNAGKNASATEDKAESLLNKIIVDDLFSLLQSPHKLLNAFESSGKNHLTKLAAYAQQGEKALFLAQVHNFKGSAATLGVQAVVSLCMEIENKREVLDSDDMSFYAKQLRIRFQQGRLALEQYLAENGSVKS